MEWDIFRLKVFTSSKIVHSHHNFLETIILYPRSAINLAYNLSEPSNPHYALFGNNGNFVSSDCPPIHRNALTYNRVPEPMNIHYFNGLPALSEEAATLERTMGGGLHLLDSSQQRDGLTRSFWYFFYLF
jgi:hypothetical protein